MLMNDMTTLFIRGEIIYKFVSLVIFELEHSLAITLNFNMTLILSPITSTDTSWFY